jgi:hypothetical protein
LPLSVSSGLAPCPAEVKRGPRWAASPRSLLADFSADYSPWAGLRSLLSWHDRTLSKFGVLALARAPNHEGAWQALAVHFGNAGFVRSTAFRWRSCFPLARVGAYGQTPKLGTIDQTQIVPMVKPQNWAPSIKPRLCPWSNPKIGHRWCLRIGDNDDIRQKSNGGRRTFPNHRQRPENDNRQCYTGG